MVSKKNKTILFSKASVEIILLPEIFVKIIEYLTKQTVMQHLALASKSLHKQITNENSKLGQYYWRSLFVHRFPKDDILQDKASKKHWMQLYKSRIAESKDIMNDREIQIRGYRVLYAANICNAPYEFQMGKQDNDDEEMDSNKKKKKKQQPPAHEEQVFVLPLNRAPQKTDTIVLKEQPIVVVSYTRSWAGKFGSPKMLVSGINIFTLKKVEEVIRVTPDLSGTFLLALVTFKKYELLNVNEEYAELLNIDDGDDYYDRTNLDNVKQLPIPKNAIGSMIKAFVRDMNKDKAHQPDVITVVVMRSMNCECIIDCFSGV